MQRLIKAQPHANNRDVVLSGALRFLQFSLVAGSSEHRGFTADRECVLDVFSGVASITLEGRNVHKTFSKVGGRKDVFSGPPCVLYLPPQCSYTIQPASDDFHAGFFSAPATHAHPPALVEPGAVQAKQVGHGSFERTVYTALGDNFAAERLLAGETLNAPGGWSSFPPHKHDRTNPPHETCLEEIYYFQIQPAGGFGFIWTYTAPGDPDGFNNVFVVENGDTVLLPKGYHPVVAAPGCRLHYTWVLAGEQRQYGAWAEDPRYSALKNSS
ncbi:MAG TPA: 5-deoxy-glucuronate isomerase [Terriglobales bacterium]|nr:5-deoxy-glucuronate isomerase [Terriglobales bacterium]